MRETIKNGWSHDVLADQIKYKLYERQEITEKVTNFEHTLPDIQTDLAIQTCTKKVCVVAIHIRLEFDSAITKLSM